MGGRSRGQGEGNKKRGQGEGNKKRRRGEGDRKRKHGDLHGDLAAVEELKKVIREHIEVDEEFATPEKMLEVEKALDENAEGRLPAERLIQIFGEAHVKKVGGIAVARISNENRQRVMAMACKGRHAKGNKTGGFEAAVQESNTNENEKEAHCEAKCGRCKKRGLAKTDGVARNDENVEAGVEINETERRDTRRNFIFFTAQKIVDLHH